MLERDLGYTLLQLNQQPRGSQFGKDIQVRWRNASGEVRFWHFECKSHGGPTLPAKEVADKLLSLARSAHVIDVWCLALSDAEPSAEIDELIAAAPESLALGFGITVLSPKRHFIKRLYACHPDLHRRQYGVDAMSLTRRERESTVEEFATWLDEESSAQRRRATPPGWTRITSGFFTTLRDDDRHARQYLRGLTLGCPWEAVVHGWCVPRPSAEAPLLRLARESEPGMTYDWLVGAGGEGKSTTLRRVAWQLAADDSETIVLWADDAAPAAVPDTWLRGLAQGTRVVMLVDETRQLTGPSAVDDGVWRDEGKAIVVILADRGSGWRRRRNAVLPRRLVGPPRQLGPLTEDERDALVAALGARGLLYDVTPSDARARLDRAAEGLAADISRRKTEESWLVPTLIQLTDPTDRPFDAILRSVLTDLRDGSESVALRGLLAIALVHAAGSALPRDLAERIAGTRDAWVDAKDALVGELERHLGASLATGRGSTVEEYETHGSAVSMGFLQAAAGDSSLTEYLSLVSRRLAEVMAPDYTATELLREDRFDLLDQAADYLAGDRSLSAYAVDLLSAWVELDESRGFPAMQRLGTAYSRWLSVARSAPEQDINALVAILDAGRSTFRRALVTTRAVLSGVRPHKYDNYDLDEHIAVIYHAWAVLELTAADAPRADLRAHGSLRRAVYLALLTTATPGRPRAMALGVLADAMFALGRYVDASRAFAVKESLSGPTDRVVRRGKTKLVRHGVEVPSQTEDLFPAVASAALAAFSGHMSDLQVEGTENADFAAAQRAVHLLSTEMPSLSWPTVVRGEPA